MQPHDPVVRVLVADGDADAGDSIILLLNALGCDVKVAHNGHDALALAAALLPDVVFAELELPGLDGLELARRLRASERRPVLVALTVRDTPESFVTAMEAGFNFVLSNADDMDRFIKTLVGDWLSRGVAAP